MEYENHLFFYFSNIKMTNLFIRRSKQEHNQRPYAERKKERENTCKPKPENDL